MQKIITKLKQTDWQRAFLGAVVFGVVFAALGKIFNYVDDNLILTAIETSIIWLVLMVLFTNVFRRKT